MDKVLIDCRCPKCNAIVRGREDVAIVASDARHRKVTQCPRCRTAIRFVTATPAAYFDTTE